MCNGNQMGNTGKIVQTLRYKEISKESNQDEEKIIAEHLRYSFSLLFCYIKQLNILSERFPHENNDTYSFFFLLFSFCLCLQCYESYVVHAVCTHNV